MWQNLQTFHRSPPSFFSKKDELLNDQQRPSIQPKANENEKNETKQKNVKFLLIFFFIYRSFLEKKTLI